MPTLTAEVNLSEHECVTLSSVIRFEVIENIPENAYCN